MICHFFHLLPAFIVGRYGKSGKKKDVTHGVQEWAIKAVHRSLLYLGDIGMHWPFCFFLDRFIV